MSALLEVAVRHARDVAGAREGGADRLLLDDDGRSPGPDVVRDVCRQSDLPVRVVLRLSDGWTTTGGEFARLVGLGQDYLDRGAAGLCLGFLDADLGVDVETTIALLERLPGVPWSFPRAIDDTLEPRRSWRWLTGLPGLDAVHSAGSPRGLGAGYDDLLELVRQDPQVAGLVLPGGGLLAEHVPWLMRAGVRQFHLDTQARPGGSLKAYVDAALVRSFRLLLDDTAERLDRV